MSRRAKPAVSAWIIRERKRLGLKPHDIAARLTAMGLPVAEGTPRTWEAGRSPSPENIEGLERIFGTAAPDMAGSTVLNGLVDPAAYLSRVDELVGLVNDLVAQNATLIELLTERPAPRGVHGRLPGEDALAFAERVASASQAEDRPAEVGL